MPSELDEVYWKIEDCAKTIMQMYKIYYLESKDSMRRFVSEKQVIRDCLESMKRSGLIKDYDLYEYTISME